ncbi:hypothetical protein ACLOJK_026534 [Asimina triloba]
MAEWHSHLLSINGSSHLYMHPLYSLLAGFCRGMHAVVASSKLQPPLHTHHKAGKQLLGQLSTAARGMKWQTPTDLISCKDAIQPRKWMLPLLDGPDSFTMQEGGPHVGFFTVKGFVKFAPFDA